MFPSLLIRIEQSKLEMKMNISSALCFCLLHFTQLELLHSIFTQFFGMNSSGQGTPPPRLPGVMEYPRLTVAGSGTNIGTDTRTPASTSGVIPSIAGVVPSSSPVPDFASPSSTHLGSEIPDSRLISPHGDSFDPSVEPIREVSETIKKHFSGPYAKFSQVPMNVRKLWFEEWSKLFKWRSEHNTLIRRNWDKVAKTRFKDEMHRARKEHSEIDPPYWIVLDDWKKLHEYWRFEAFMRASRYGRSNRAAVSYSIHNDGLISFSEHERRMRKSDGEGFTYRNLYKKTHTIQTGPNKSQFSSDKAQTMNNVNALADQYSQLESTGSFHPSRLDDKALFVEAAGSFKKGHVSGLRSEAPRVRRRFEQDSSSSQSTQSASSKLLNIEFEIQERVSAQVGMEVSKIRMRFEHKFRVMKAREESLQTYLINLASQMGFPAPPILPSVPEDDIFANDEHIIEDDAGEKDFTISPVSDHLGPSTHFDPPSPPTGATPTPAMS